MSDAIIVAIIGAVAVLAVAVIREIFRYRKKRSDLVRDEKYGIRISSPNPGAAVVGEIEVSGTCAVPPPIGSFYLVNVIDGIHHFPQVGHPIEIDPVKRTWRGRSWVFGPTRIVAMTVGPNTKVLFGYYAKVGRETQKWPSIEQLPADHIEHDAVSVRSLAGSARPPKLEETLLPRPRLISTGHRNALKIGTPPILRRERETVSVWVYLHRTGEGIRALVNNRYIFACATHASSPYKNVFAVAHGPLRCYDPPSEPSWKLWIANNDGSGDVWTYPDGGEFEPGWHLVLVRWDHDAPRLELLMDRKKLISNTEYQHLWPQQYSDRFWVGCWPSGDEIHYANTHLANLTTLSDFADDGWIEQELHRVPADPLI